jgi:general secretion pathway protein C
MGLNLSARYFTALNLLLMVGIAYFAALSANDVIKGRLVGSVTIKPLPAPAALAPEPTYPRSHYDQIVNRDIFNAPAEEAAAPVVSEDLHLKLLGTSIQTAQQPWAIIEDERNAKQALYQLGDDIPDAGKLVAVERTKVFIERQGKRVALEIPEDQMPAVPPSGFPSVGVPDRPHRAAELGSIRPMGPNHFAIDRSTVNGNLQNMMSLFTQMRAVPDIENGASKGFKLSEIQPGSVFQQMGLQDGDVVTGIGGQPLTDPREAMQLLSSMRNEDSVGISIIRGGRTMQFTYDIH